MHLGQGPMPSGLKALCRTIYIYIYIERERERERDSRYNTLEMSGTKIFCSNKKTRMITEMEFITLLYITSTVIHISYSRSV